MEGLDALPVEVVSPPSVSHQLAERWLAFLFMLMLGAVAVVAVCAELLAVRG